MYKVIETETYRKELRKWSKADIEAAKKISQKLAINPFVGDPLSYPFLREERVKKKRIYFLVYGDLKLVLVVATSGKDDQQSTINYLKNNLGEFKILAEHISKRLF